MSSSTRRKAPPRNFQNDPVHSFAPGPDHVLHGKPPTYTTALSEQLWNSLTGWSVIDFVRGKPRDDDSPKSDQWHVKRVLGEGAYGSVAVWEKGDIDGQIIHEIVLKSIDYEPKVDDNSPGINPSYADMAARSEREAQIMSSHLILNSLQF